MPEHDSARTATRFAAPTAGGCGPRPPGSDRRYTIATRSPKYAACVRRAHLSVSADDDEFTPSLHWWT